MKNTNNKNYNISKRADAIIAKALENKTKLTMGVVFPTKEESINGAILAAKIGLITPLFIGPLKEMYEAAKKIGQNLSDYECIDAENGKSAIDTAIRMIKLGRINSLIKGSLHTNTFMHAIISRNAELRTNRRISHCFVVDTPSHHKLMVMSDCAINIANDLLTKKDTIQNAIDFSISLGIKKPKVAILSAIETITESLPSTLDANELCNIAKRGEITGGMLKGPLSFDLAISKKACAIKGMESSVAGDADIFIAPSLEAGNIMVKSLEYLANAVTAGIVLGAKIPIILTSRASGANERLLSCALAKIAFKNFK